MNLKTSFKRTITPISVLPCIFAVILIGFLLKFNPYSLSLETKNSVQNLPIVIATSLCVLYLFLLHKLGKIEYKNIIAVLFVLGFAMRLMYCLEFGFTQNQHDVENLNTNGHLSYIYGLATGNGLPNTNDWQFCHPPLHHYLASLVVKFSLNLGLETAAAFENVQMLTCLYSTLLMFVGYLILKELSIKGRPLIFASALLSFHPSFFILAGSINNDTLTVLFTAVALLYLIKWYKRPTVNSALFCGLFTGLAMMTKFSAAVMIVVSAVAVLIKLISSKSFNFPAFLKHSSAFLAVSLPIGLWYQIRNGILFGQPLGYVAKISTESKLFIGDLSFAERFLWPISKPNNVYVDVWNEHNLWQYILRNSLFGEYSFGSQAFAAIAVLANVILSLAVIIAVIVLNFKRRDKFVGLLPVTVMFIVQWIAFIYFNIVSPYRCSMDFRYIVPVLFCSVCFIGALLDGCDKKGGLLCNLISSVVEGTVVIFCISSVLVFI